MTSTAHITRLASALELAGQGLAVLPLHPVQGDVCGCSTGAECSSPGKHPIQSGWERVATSEGSTVAVEWGKNPGRGIGIHLGKSGLVVLDIDPRNDGIASLSRLEQLLGLSFDKVGQVIADTGGGGQHYYFRPDPQQVDQLAALTRHLARNYPGIDLLHGRHFCVAAPSMHKSGKAYRWREGRADWEWLSAFPAALLALVDTPVEAVNSHEGSLTLDDDDVLGAALQDDEESQPNIDRVRSALDSIGADCDRDTWRDVLFILHSTRWKCAKPLAREWSESAPKLFNEKNFNDTWRSAKERTNGLKLGSLFRMATANGWIDPRKKGGSGDIGGGSGDVVDGRRFAEQYRGEFLYCHGLKTWYQWDGLRWARCKSGQHIEAAKLVLERSVKDAQARYRQEPTDEALRRAKNQAEQHFQNAASRIPAMLTMAGGEPGMSVSDPGAFDVNPYLFAARNGVIDLETGELIQASRDMYITKAGNAHFDREAKCPRWLKFLDEIFSGNAALVGYIQCALGQTLTGDVREEKVFFMHGYGANGKSVFSNVVNVIFGDYAQVLSSDLIAKGGKNSSESDRQKARLPGVRLALINEVGQNDTWDDQRVKEITSREPISARLLHKESFTFYPTHHSWIRGNHQPAVQDSGDGMWRRIDLVPFLRQFTGDQQDPHLEKGLLEERDGILNWMVEGCLKWQQDGLPVVAAIQGATNAYRKETDAIGQWLERRCIHLVGSRLERGEALRDFQEFVKKNFGANSNVTDRKFANEMKVKGFESAPSNGKRYFKGLTLAPHEYEGGWWRDEL